MIEYKKYFVNESIIIHSELINELNQDTIKNYLAKSDYCLFDQSKSFRRKQEFITIRMLIKDYLQKESFLFYENNKPKLTTHTHISISHKNQEIIVCFNENKEIGVDIEKIDIKINNIQYKFCNEQELVNRTNIENIEFLTMLWCAKEATYKCLDYQNGVYLKDISTLINNSSEGISYINGNEYKLDFINLEGKYIICHAEKND